MKAAELRIGNYIQCKPLSIPRLNISTEGIMNVTGYGISVIESDTNDSMGFEAIPLTEEWLVTLGFETKGGVCYKKKSWFEIEYVKGKLWFTTFGKDVHVKHVHQLQNLYFTLTGEELI